MVEKLIAIVGKSPETLLGFVAALLLSLVILTSGMVGCAIGYLASGGCECQPCNCQSRECEVTQ